LVVIFREKNCIYFSVSQILYLQSFFFLYLLNVSPWGHVRRRGGKRSVLPVGKYSQYIFVHIRLKKKEGNMWKKGRGRRIHFFPHRRNSLHHSKQVGRIINMKKNWYYFRYVRGCGSRSQTFGLYNMTVHPQYSIFYIIILGVSGHFVWGTCLRTTGVSIYNILQFKKTQWFRNKIIKGFCLVFGWHGRKSGNSKHQ